MQSSYLHIIYEEKCFPITAGNSSPKKKVTQFLNLSTKSCEKLHRQVTE